MNLLKKTEFAKQLGVQPGYVTQLKDAGRLVIVDGKVDVAASLQLIADTEDPGKVGVVERHAGERAQKALAPGPVAATRIDQLIDQSTNRPAMLEDMAGKAGSAYQQARAMKEKYFAMQAKIAYEKEVGLLLVAGEVKFAIADGDAIIRNRLESLPDMLAPQLAAEHDEGRIRAMLADHIEDLLSELSRSFYGMVKN
jgi:hypothetical protein